MQSEERGTEEGQPQVTESPPPEPPIQPKKNGPQGKRKARAVLARERMMRAVMLRKAGATFEQIGEELGVTKVRAFQMVDQYLKELHEQTREVAVSLKAMEMMRLDEMQLHLWAIATSTANGFAERMQAMDRVLKIMERRAKYENLDQIPEATVNIKTETRKVMAPILAGATTEELEQMRSIVGGMVERASNGDGQGVESGPASTDSVAEPGPDGSKGSPEPGVGGA